MSQKQLELFQNFSEGLAELPSALNRLGKLAGKQDDARRQVVLVLNRLGDALKAAGDHVTVALSEQIVGYQEASTGTVKDLRSFYSKASIALRREALSKRLKRGRVCAELHVLFDQYGRPATGPALGGQSAADWLRGLFGKSSKMKNALGLLWEGEKEYLYEIASFLQDAADDAEMLTKPKLRKAELLQGGEALTAKLREKRSAVQSGAARVEKRVEKTIEALIGKLT